MRDFFLCAAVAAVFLTVGCSEKKGSVDVAQFTGECQQNCAKAFNGCMSLAKSPEAEKQCDTFFNRCKNDCAAKERAAAEPKPEPKPEPAAEPEQKPEPAAE